jgi:hypothetical protein
MGASCSFGLGLLRRARCRTRTACTRAPGAPVFGVTIATHATHSNLVAARKPPRRHKTRGYNLQRYEYRAKKSQSPARE